MTTNITLTYYGMPGEGPTVAKARADAATKIAAVLADVDAGPRLVCVANHTALIYRDLHGFAYKILTGTDGMKAGRIFGSSHGQHERETVRQAVLHMAQNAWTHEVADDAEFAALCVDRQLSSRDAEASMKSWLVDYFNWQRRYRLARDAGMADGDCHALACRTRDLAHAATEIANLETTG